MSIPAQNLWQKDQSSFFWAGNIKCVFLSCIVLKSCYLTVPVLFFGHVAVCTSCLLSDWLTNCLSGCLGWIESFSGFGEVALRPIKFHILCEIIALVFGQVYRRPSVLLEIEFVGFNWFIFYSFWSSSREREKENVRILLKHAQLGDWEKDENQKVNSRCFDGERERRFAHKFEWRFRIPACCMPGWTWSTPLKRLANRRLRIPRGAIILLKTHSWLKVSPLLSFVCLCWTVNLPQKSSAAAPLSVRATSHSRSSSIKPLKGI